jgi:hypothetical protein
VYSPTKQFFDSRNLFVVQNEAFAHTPSLVAHPQLCIIVSSQETLAEAEARIQALEEARATAESEAAQVERASVQRATEKQKV